MVAKRAQPCWKFRLGGVMFDIVGIVMLETPMSNNSEGAAGDLTADLAAVRQDVARLAETVSELVQHQMADAQENVRAARSEIEAGIERNPMMAVLIAFGVGMLIGRMNRSRG